MLFKNLKSGNLVAPKDRASAEMMARSANYAEVRTSTPEKKTAKSGKSKRGV